MGIPLYLSPEKSVGQEATVRTRQGTTDWLQLRKEVHQAVYYHPAYLTYCRVHHEKHWAG